MSKDEQIAALTAGLWAIYAAVGADTDGDETPAALIAGMGLNGFIRVVKEEVAAHLDSDEEGEREAAAQGWDAAMTANHGVPLYQAVRNPFRTGATS